MDCAPTDVDHDFSHTQCPLGTKGGEIYFEALQTLGPSARIARAVSEVCTCGQHRLSALEQ